VWSGIAIKCGLGAEGGKSASGTIAPARPRGLILSARRGARWISSGSATKTYGSLSELAYLLRFARDGQFLTDEAWAKLQQMRDKAAILTWRLARSLATSK
jgi:hypothetical protein